MKSTTPIIAIFAMLTAACGKKTVATVETPPAEIAAAAATYPLDVCLVSGEELGSMGEPTSLVHNGQEIKFCCDHCEPKFKKDPAKYLSKLQKS